MAENPYLARTASKSPNRLPMPAAENLTNAPEFTVSELSSALKRTVEDTYGHVRVRGEISGFRGPHSSGHCYFALKDESAKIEAVIWKGVHGRMRFKPQEGLEVIATGKLTTYPGSSKYQIVIEAIEPAGIGALMALMEERKKKLAAEGLFDEARKQLLPWLPEVIGVVTSPTGAVIRDILHRLQDRFPRRVLVWPVKVQGEGSAEQVAAAIRGFNALPEGGKIPRPDLLIVARGGGSLEDLWSFNEEIVVRAAADSMIPLISAVGHETDITLIDFAADKRAPTPTAAAEMAVPGAQRIVRRGDGAGAAHDDLLAARPGRPPQRIARRRPRVARRRRTARDPAAAARQRGRRPAPRTEGQYACASSPLLASQRRPDAEGAARTGRARQAAPDGIRRAHQAFHPRAAAPAPRSLCRAGGPAQGLKTLQRAGAAQRHRARPRTHAAPGRARPPRAGDGDAAAGSARGVTAASCCRRCPIAACWRAALRWCAMRHGHALHAAAAVGPNAHLSIEFADGRVGATADADRPPATSAPASEPQAGTARGQDDGGQARGQAGRSGKPVLEFLLTLFCTRTGIIRSKTLSRQPLGDALLRIRARFGVGADMAVFRQRGVGRRRSHAAADWRGRNHATRRDRSRSASARCGRARRRPSGGRPTAN